VGKGVLIIYFFGGEYHLKLQARKQICKTAPVFQEEKTG